MLAEILDCQPHFFNQRYFPENFSGNLKLYEH